MKISMLRCFIEIFFKIVRLATPFNGNDVTSHKFDRRSCKHVIGSFNIAATLFELYTELDLASRGYYSPDVTLPYDTTVMFSCWRFLSALDLDQLRRISKVCRL
jgi:hypothetical protein